ncbi:MAG: hypothetical protein CMJ33_03050 [Phycisphaerae bacterium]|nr:hypothetical protein [Phycisphaerae bacterium]
MHLSHILILILGLNMGITDTSAEALDPSVARPTDRRSSEQSRTVQSEHDIETHIESPRLESGKLPATHTMELFIHGSSHVIDLTRCSVRSPGFRLIIDDGESLREIQPPDSCTYEGTIRGHAHSRVALQHGATGWTGSIDRGLDGGTLFIQPIKNDSGMHSIRAAAWEGPIGLCGTESSMTFKSRSGTEYRSSSGQISRVLDLTVDVDKAYADLLNGDIDLILEDVESIIHATSSIFENDLNLEILLTAVIVRESNADYPSTTAQDLVCDGIYNWSAYAGNAGDIEFNTDVIQIFTGRPLSGVIGYAFLGTACASNQTSCGLFSTIPNKCIVASRYTDDLSKRIALSAHEIAHTLGATHCSGSSCRIMCPSIGDCGGLDGSPLSFGVYARSQMNSFISLNLEPCLESGAATVDPPVSTSFETGEPDVWEFSVGGFVQYSGGVHPDGNRYAVFEKDSTTSDNMICSRITSRVDLKSRRSGKIEFWLKHQSFTYSPMRLHALNASGNWVLLRAIANEAGTSWTEFSVDLPSEIMWEGARFRFSCSPAAGNEKWLLDFVRITASDVMASSNDECTSPDELTAGINVFDTIGATDSIPQSDGGCSGSTIRSDVWFEFEAPCTGTVTATSCQLSPLDLQIRAYSLDDDDCTEGPLSLVACADDEICPVPGAYINFDSVAGTRYLIQCGTYDGTTGSATVYIDCEETERPACPGDFNEDGVIDGPDLTQLLASWNSSENDLNDDGIVDGIDLAIVLAGWGLCP